MDVAFCQQATRVVRDLVLTDFTADSCITSTRVLIDTLTYFGINARPYAVEVAVFNEDARTILETDGIHGVHEAVFARGNDEPGGPWTLGLGLNVAVDAGAGHVIAGIPTHSILLDASIDQVSRPHKNILLEPFATTIEGDFFTAPDGRCVITATPTSGGPTSTLMYTHSPHKRYLDSPNWRRRTSTGPSTVFREMTGEAIRRLRDQGATG